MPMYSTPREWMENVPEDEWPREQVSCATPGCVNEGIVFSVPAIGQNVLCAGCGEHVIERTPSAGRG